MSVVEATSALHDVRCIGDVIDLHQNSTALYFTLTDGNAELPCMLKRELLSEPGHRPGDDVATEAVEQID